MLQLVFLFHSFTGKIVLMLENMGLLVLPAYVTDCTLFFMASHPVESHSEAATYFPDQYTCLAPLLHLFPMLPFTRAHVLERNTADVSDVAMVIKVR